MSVVNVRRAEDAAPLMAVLDVEDAATFRMLGDLEERGIGRDVRGWLAEDAEGKPAGVLTVAELCRGRWYASVMLFDEVAAPALAEVLMHSPAWEVSGSTEHVQPLVPHLTRLHSVTSAPWSIVPELDVEVPPELLPDRDPRCRLATVDDLDVLVDVYSTYELEAVPTRRRLRAYLERTLAHRPVLVSEVDGMVVAAYRVEFMTSRYAYWSGLTVLPSHRRQHLASGITWDAFYVTRDLGRGLVTTTAASNPMQLRPQTELRQQQRQVAADHGWTMGEWVKVRLGPPQRFPGHHYLRRAMEIAEGPVRRRQKGPDVRPPQPG